MDAELANSMLPTIARTLAHFLWQGVALWMAAAGLVQVASPRRAQTRYAIYCLTLATLAACPVVTYVTIAGDTLASRVDSELASDTIEPTWAHSSGNPAADESVASATPSWIPGPLAVQGWIDRNSLAIALAWLAGMTCFGGRLTVGAVRVWILTRQAEPLPSDVADRVERLARMMRLRSTPVVRVAGRVSQAMAVGLIKPIVLLPVAWVSQLRGDVLDAVIAHELAHVRRWDLPVNFLQRSIEAVLFFHPVVWWCSRRIRIEREMCCDELALAALGSPAEYAKALTYLADHELAVCEPLWGAGIGGPSMVLLARIRNVLGMTSLRHGRLYGPTCAVVGAATASLVWVLLVAPRSSDELVEPMTTAMPPETPIANVPTEHDKILIPNYTIEPPDILFIEAQRVYPKGPYRLQAGDELQIIADPPEAGLRGRGFFVDSEGRIDLGPAYGEAAKVKVSGLTADEATQAIRKVVSQLIRDPHISVTIITATPMQPITGEHLVAPDGNINLGSYGQVDVAGLTLEEGKAKIEASLEKFLDHPEVSVSVFAYNSKVYYVIVEGGDKGDMVTRVVITGNETVLDALTHVSGLRGLSNKRIWIARPTPDGARHDRVLPVDWQAITKGASSVTNYQVLPGDRIFVVDESAARKSRY